MVPQPVAALLLLFPINEQVRWVVRLGDEARLPCFTHRASWVGRMRVRRLLPAAQYEQFRLAEQARIEQAGQTRSGNVVFVKQTIGNACGTIGLIHSVCNNAHRIPLGTWALAACQRRGQLSTDRSFRGAPMTGLGGHTGDGFFARFAEDAKTKTPDELAQLLEGNRVLSEVHEQAAQSGQSEVGRGRS